MISFISETLLKEELSYKFMWKHKIKNYFRQFKKTMSVCFQWNTAHTDFVLYNYVWLEQLNASAEYEVLSDENIRFIGQNLQSTIV